MNRFKIVMLITLVALIGCKKNTRSKAERNNINNESFNSYSADSLFNIGYDTYINEGNDAGFRMILNAHSRGSEKASLFIGNLYLFGYGEMIDGENIASGIKKDVKLGIKILDSLAVKGSSEANLNLSEYYLGSANNNLLGLKYLNKSVELNNDMGMYYLGNLYITGNFNETNIDFNLDTIKGITLLNNASKNNNFDAMYTLAILYLRLPSSNHKDTLEAEKLLRKLKLEAEINESIGIDQNDIDGLLKTLKK